MMIDHHESKIKLACKLSTVAVKRPGSVTRVKLRPINDTYLHEKKFNDEIDIKTGIDTFFNHKSNDFCEHGILSLPERWQQLIDTDGAYIGQN